MNSKLIWNVRLKYWLVSIDYVYLYLDFSISYLNLRFLKVVFILGLFLSILFLCVSFYLYINWNLLFYFYKISLILLSFQCWARISFNFNDYICFADGQKKFLILKYLDFIVDCRSNRLNSFLNYFFIFLESLILSLNLKIFHVPNHFLPIHCFLVNLGNFKFCILYL